MINDAAKHVNEVLTLPSISAVLNTNSFWDLAPQDQGMPYANFKLTNEGRVTKNKASQYSVELFIYAASLNDATTIADDIINTIDESEYKWRFRGSESGYNYSDGREAICTINYEFKL